MSVVLALNYSETKAFLPPTEGVTLYSPRYK